MLFNVCNKEQYNGGKGEDDENSCCNPMGNSLGIPILNAVTECQSNNAHTYKSEGAENVVKLALEAVPSVHILRVENDTARGENTPEPEVNLSVFTEKRKSAELTCRIISPTEGENKSVHKRDNKSDNTKRFKKVL